MKHTYWETNTNCDFRKLTKVTIDNKEYELYFTKPEAINGYLRSYTQELEVPCGAKTLKFKIILSFDKTTVSYKMKDTTIDSKEDISDVFYNVSGCKFSNVTSQSFVEELDNFGKSLTERLPRAIKATENRNHKLLDNQSLPKNVLHVPFRGTMKEVPFKFKETMGNGKEPCIGEKAWVYWEWQARSLIFTIPITTNVKADVCIIAKYLKDARCNVSDPSHCDWVSEAEYSENMEEAIKNRDYTVYTNGYSTVMSIKRLYIGDTVIERNELYNVIGMCDVSEEKSFRSVSSAFTSMENHYITASHPLMLKKLEEYKKAQAKVKRQTKKSDEEKELFEEYKKNREQFLKWLKDNQ